MTALAAGIVLVLVLKVLRAGLGRRRARAAPTVLDAAAFGLPRFRSDPLSGPDRGTL